MKLQTIKIAIEINGERYEKKYESIAVMADHFSDLFCEAGIIDENQSLRGVDSAQEYMLDR